MIRFAEERDQVQIYKIWQESFGDSREEIKEFFSVCANSVRICVVTEDDSICGFLCLLSATLRIPKSFQDKYENMWEQNQAYPTEYIYAVATDKAYRNRGVCTCLLDYVKRILVNEGKCGILVPANPRLEQFYQNRGFACCYKESSIQISRKEMLTDSKSNDDKMKFTGNPMDMDTIKVRQLGAAEYIYLREKALRDISHVELAKDVLTYAIHSKQCEGVILSKIILDKREYGFLYSQKDDVQDTLFIEETTAVTEVEIQDAVCALLYATGKDQAEVRISYPTYGIRLPDGHPYCGSMNLVLD